MKVTQYSESKTVSEIEGVSRRDIVTTNDGASHFTMQIVEVTARAATPTHHHPWEHAIFIIVGKGMVVGEKGGAPIAEGNVVFIPSNETHCFVNTGDETLRYINIDPINVQPPKEKSGS